jgi:hypothetical protein
MTKSFKIIPAPSGAEKKEPPKKQFGSSMELPTERSIPVTNIADFSMFFYGKQGIGKTSFTAQFPDTLHILFEPGAKTEEIFQMHPENIKDVHKILSLLKGTERFQFVVLDTIDLFWDMVTKEVCKRAGVEMLKDIGFGDGYTQAGDMFRNILIELQASRGLILLAHDKEKMKTNDNDVDYIIPSTAKRGAETVGKWVDLTGHYYMDKYGKHLLRIRSSKDRESKNRIKHMFKYTDGTLINDINMGNSEQESYANFMLAFNNKLENPRPIKKLNKPADTTSKFSLNKKS